MSKTRTTLTVEEEVLRAVRIKAARDGKRDSEVIEESLRRDMGLDELERIWARVKPLPEKEGLKLAYQELQAMRREKDAAGGTRP
jgi:gamma-glutamyl:cysteine ligase YbdK (ATP-grasp superfamily)